MSWHLSSYSESFWRLIYLSGSDNNAQNIDVVVSPCDEKRLAGIPTTWRQNKYIYIYVILIRVTVPKTVSIDIRQWPWCWQLLSSSAVIFPILALQTWVKLPPSVLTQKTSVCVCAFVSFLGQNTPTNYGVCWGLSDPRIGAVWEALWPLTQHRQTAPSWSRLSPLTFHH